MKKESDIHARSPSDNAVRVWVGFPGKVGRRVGRGRGGGGGGRKKNRIFHLCFTVLCWVSSVLV